MRSLPLTRWRFSLGDDPAAAAKGFDDTAWRKVAVPHDWSIEHAFSPECSSGTGYLPGGVGWYRAHASLAELGATAAQHVRLAFDGVYKNADVWVNGYHLGGRPSGHTPFSFDLTEIVGYAPDDDLVVSVRVARTDLSDSRWYNGTGITREVRLEVDEAIRVRPHGTRVTTLSATADEAVVEIAEAIVNDTADDVTVEVVHELHALDSGRRHTSATHVAVPGAGSADAVARIAIPDPELWSDEAPHLYRVRTVLRWSGGEADAELVTGLRVFAFDPDRGLAVNGAPRVLRGVCLHEDAGSFGVAVPVEVWLRRLLTLKDMGCNAIRMAHNPHAPALYALCDALGFYVIDEAFDEWENPKNKWWQGHNVYPPRHEGYAHDFPHWHERDLLAMIDAHRHHPSILAWSIGNEVDYPNDPYASPLFDEMTGNNDANKPAAERVYDPARPDVRRLTTIARRLADIARTADPTRPVTLAAAFPELSGRTGLLEPLDLVGYNYKEHLYAQDHARFPDKPFLGSENGHGFRQWRHVLEKDYIAGQFLWTGIDYLGEARGWPIHGSGAGVMDLAGFPKHTWHLRRSWWSDEPTAYLVTRPSSPDADRSFWSHPVSRRWEDGDAPVEVLCFARADALRLACAGEEIPLSRDEENGWWTATVAPAAAPLVLEALVGGVVRARDELHARGDARSIDAEIWGVPAGVRERLAETGVGLGEVVQIACTLRDEAGRVADEDRVLAVSVAGGTLLGLENGDLADVTAYTEPHRATVDGRLMVYLRPSASTVVTIGAAGLPELILEL